MNVQTNHSLPFLAPSGGRKRIFTWLATLLLLSLCASNLAAKPDFSMKGWATTGQGTTGGAGGDVVTVSNTRAFLDAINRNDPVVILVSGTLDFRSADTSHPAITSGRVVKFKSNKSVLGLGSNAAILYADFSLSEVHNVIIRNLKFANAPDTAIGIRNGSTHIWIDHNDFSNAPDGLLDITRGADFVTVSWNRFSEHVKTALVGSSDGMTSDRNKLRVTYHHNWFVGTNERHPRVRYGKVHVFNNYYDQINAGIAIGVEAQIFSERNYFNKARTPWHYQDNSSQPGYMRDSGSIIVSPTNSYSLKSSGVKWNPGDHYSYTLDSASDVPNLVSTYAGRGVIDPRAPDQPPAPEDPKEPEEPKVPVEAVGLIARYSFKEGSGDTVKDESGFSNSADLRLTGGAQWVEGGGVMLDGATARLESKQATTALADQIMSTGQFTLELWLKPADVNQAGPARIVSYSAGQSKRNFTLGHGQSYDPTGDLIFRVRTTGDNEQAEVPQQIASEPTHYAVTYDGKTVHVYRNGELEHSTERVGTLANWDRSYLLVLGNEPTGDRGWAGELKNVAIYDTALSGSAIHENYLAVTADNPPSEPAATTFDEWLDAAYPDGSGADLDPASDPTGAGVPNLVRYALGIDPKTPYAPPTHEVSVATDGTNGDEFLSVQYNRRRNITDVKILLEASSDLENWEILDTKAETKVVPNGELETVTVLDTVPVGSSPQRFIRIRVEKEVDL